MSLSHLCLAAVGWAPAGLSARSPSKPYVRVSPHAAHAIRGGPAFIRKSWSQRKANNFNSAKPDAKLGSRTSKQLQSSYSGGGESTRKAGRRGAMKWKVRAKPLAKRLSGECFGTTNAALRVIRVKPRTFHFRQMTRPPLALTPSGLPPMLPRRRPPTLRACGVFARRSLPVVPSSPLALWVVPPLLRYVRLWITGTSVVEWDSRRVTRSTVPRCEVQVVMITPGYALAPLTGTPGPANAR
ncbi:hypothetical protein EJ110_NYTH58925 [Nymphaea thermarum]|nr:hypothetical protein EJ110_NYTH58925 [Nymphaea thermarum]